MKQTTVAHKLFCDITISLTGTYLPYSIFLVQPLYASVTKGTASTFIWYGAAAGFEPTTSGSESGRSTN